MSILFRELWHMTIYFSAGLSTFINKRGRHRCCQSSSSDSRQNFLCYPTSSGRQRKLCVIKKSQLCKMSFDDHRSTGVDPLQAVDRHPTVRKLGVDAFQCQNCGCIGSRSVSASPQRCMMLMAIWPEWHSCPSATTLTQNSRWVPKNVVLLFRLLGGELLHVTSRPIVDLVCSNIRKEALTMHWVVRPAPPRI